MKRCFQVFKSVTREGEERARGTGNGAPEGGLWGRTLGLMVGVLVGAFALGGVACDKTKKQQGEEKGTAQGKESRPGDMKGRGEARESRETKETREARGTRETKEARETRPPPSRVEYVRPTPLKENPLEALRPLVTKLTKGMTAQLAGTAPKEAYGDIDLTSERGPRFKAFMSLLKLTSFKKATGAVVEVVLYFMKGAKTVAMLKTSVFMARGKAALVDFKVKKAPRGVPRGVMALEKLPAGLSSLKGAVEALAKVVTSKSCASLPVLPAKDATPWFSPRHATQIATDINEVRNALKKHCAQLLNLESDTLAVRMDDVSYLVVDDGGKPAGQIKVEFDEEGGKPVLEVRGKLRSLRPIGAKR